MFRQGVTVLIPRDTPDYALVLSNSSIRNGFRLWAADFQHRGRTIATGACSTPDGMTIDNAPDMGAVE
jgi:hypothetical protein